jgi:hypothetical protein
VAAEARPAHDDRQGDITLVLRHVSQDRDGVYAIHRPGLTNAHIVTKARHGDNESLLRVVGWVLTVMAWHGRYRPLTVAEHEVCAAAIRLERWLTPVSPQDAVH